MTGYFANPLNDLGVAARAAARLLARASGAEKNLALEAMAKGLRAQADAILAANRQDMEEARAGGMPSNMLDRLMLDEKRLGGIIDGLNVIHALADPVDRLLERAVRPNGLRIEKRAVPLGVIGIIFEARPNVTMDAAALCLKSGNACILRPGSEIWRTSQALVGVIQTALDEAGLPRMVVQTLPSPGRELVGALLELDRHVDLIIPRGGKSLTARVKKESRIPVLGHLDGICHTYIDVMAAPGKAVAVALNAKMRRTSICGATECLLLHRGIVPTLGKDIVTALLQAGCEVRVPDRELERWLLRRARGETGPDEKPPEPVLSGLGVWGELATHPMLKRAQAGDYGFEFAAPVIAVASVADEREAAAFINFYGSGHTEAIVTEDKGAADTFLRHVESAIVMVNASTQFADGGEFGKGAEIGIATGKLHARGPVGLEELTTYQYRVYGEGQVRG